MQTKRWYHICVTHNTQRALNGGNTIKVYIDGVLASSERLRSAILPGRLKMIYKLFLNAIFGSVMRIVADHNFSECCIVFGVFICACSDSLNQQNKTRVLVF